MTDVRLTATNPDDSSVVPVACNAKGELKLEEPLAPPEFDGNFDGDLAVTGSATFAGEVVSGGLSGAGGVGPNAYVFTGYVDAGQGGALSSSIDRNGAAEFAGQIDITAVGGLAGFGWAIANNGGLANKTPSGSKIVFENNGAANFAGDVVVGSRSKRWMLVESNGLCHMVEQTSELVSTADLVEPSRKPVSTADLVEPQGQEYPKLRDVISELDLVEQALQAVMEKLGMDSPAGWPVWDGSA